MRNQIAVHVTHAEPLLAAGLIATIADVPEFNIVAAPASRDEWRGTQVVVADYECGLATRAQLLDELGNHAPPVLIITHLDMGRYVRVALEQGISGYILQCGRSEDLVNGIRMLARGMRYLTPALASEMANCFSQSRLTNRENEVLGLLVEGYGNKMIAYSLGIALNTVKVHVKALMLKLDSITRTQVVVTAISRGLVHDKALGRRLLDGAQ
jgi:DNA-binding NarL/FixJ family response regulator